MGKMEKEINALIRLGKKTGDMKLRNSAQKALYALQADDGTYGLGGYLWENSVYPNLIIARERARYHSQALAVVNVTKALSYRHL